MKILTLTLTLDTLTLLPLGFVKPLTNTKMDHKLVEIVCGKYCGNLY